VSLPHAVRSTACHAAPARPSCSASWPTEVAEAVGVPGAAVYAWVRRAVLTGQIEKQERRLYPVDHTEMAA
jgi:hypothetical protein